MKQPRLSSTTSDQRSSLTANYIISLMKHGRIKLTLATAKKLRPYIEGLITKLKKDNLKNRRMVAAEVFNQWDLVKSMFEKVGPAVLERPGGYLRIVKFPSFRTDAAPMCLLEFVDFDNIYSSKSAETPAIETPGESNSSTETASTTSEDETAETL